MNCELAIEECRGVLRRDRGLGGSMRVDVSAQRALPGHCVPLAIATGVEPPDLG